MRRYGFVQVDVFADAPFAGNPLAVFPQAQGLSADEMQAVAREMNLSETTFVTPPEGEGQLRVRIFTPELELPFAGHPSVGTACVAVQLRLVEAASDMVPVVLELGVGPTVVDVQLRGGAPVAGVVHQGPAKLGAVAPRAEAAAVLGLSEEDLHPELSPRVVSTGLAYTIVPLRDAEALAGAAIVTARARDFETRFAELYPFAFVGDDPWVEARGLFPFSGIPEDPATGSAAGPLAAYLHDVGLLPTGKTRVVLQGRHIRRPRRLADTRATESHGGEGVLGGGGVVPVVEGELRL